MTFRRIVDLLCWELRKLRLQWEVDGWRCAIDTLSRLNLLFRTRNLYRSATVAALAQSMPKRIQFPENHDAQWNSSRRRISYAIWVSYLMKFYVSNVLSFTHEESEPRRKRMSLSNSLNVNLRTRRMWLQFCLSSAGWDGVVEQWRWVVDICGILFN